MASFEASNTAILPAALSFYWISFDGGPVPRGEVPFKADEMQPIFSDAMEPVKR